MALGLHCSYEIVILAFYSGISEAISCSTIGLDINYKMIMISEDIYLI